VIDDLGHAVTFEAPPRRIVSLVPSLSEALAVTVGSPLGSVTHMC
jgi:ABC-type Fe3+-hydroxamate transport system substrate-binding protein